MPQLALDFRLFRYAAAAAEHGSFGQAATALNVQQSTVSRGVRSLEHRVGATLFERRAETATGGARLEYARVGDFRRMTWSTIVALTGT